MKKLEMNKKTIITIIATALLILAVVVCLVMCGEKDTTGSNKDTTGKDNVKTEQNDDTNKGDKETDSEGGLQILGPEDADKQENSNQVEFVNPDGTSNENTTGNGETTGQNKEEEDTEEDPEKDNEDEDKYGELF